MARKRVTARQRTTRSTPRRAGVTAAVPETPLLLRLPSGDEIPLRQDADPRMLQRDAMYWAYVVRSRRRWAGTDLAAESPVHRLISATDLPAIARAEVVEIEIPFSNEEAGWEYRVLPWEHLISEATKPFRGERSLIVVRRLRVQAPAAAPRDVLARVAIVESAPAGLDRWYDVKGEGDLMLDSLGLQPSQVRIVSNPTAAELRAETAGYDPTLLHLAGVDSHQAIELLGLPDVPAAELGGPALDGLALRGAGMAPALTAAMALADLVNAGPHRPELVLCNFYNSASRIAALTVAGGARAAIGYQDVIEDTLAAAFCTAFYRALRAGDSLLDSFRQGLAGLRQRPARLKGAGVVLWSLDSLVAADPSRARRRARTVSRQLRPVADVPAAERIRVDVRPLASINYSLLHNRRSLFEKLDIARRDVVGPIDNIEVSATLYVGQESFPFQLNLRMKEDDDYLPIADRVVVPLTSSVIRTQGESIQSSLYLKVTCAGEVVHADTSRVQLSPVDEWTDTDENRWWLPSFVLPRDPTVASIVDRAQRYLMAMADDPSAGFDGYQSVDEAIASPEERYAPVDLQVRAIWSALLYDYRLHYVNPPPSYSASRQRLRTPTDVVRGNRGTCIDLALLLCACLEYVDIYPVVFLLAGHAFPGYWRHDRLHDDFRSLKDVPLPERSAPDALRASERTTVHFEDGYALKNFAEARSLLASERVVPLETVWLTTQGPFAEAVEEGRRNLRRPAEFDSMIDITLARANGVTPLPILWRTE